MRGIQGVDFARCHQSEQAAATYKHIAFQYTSNCIKGLAVFLPVWERWTSTDVLLDARKCPHNSICCVCGAASILRPSLRSLHRGVQPSVTVYSPGHKPWPQPRSETQPRTLHGISVLWFRRNEKIGPLPVCSVIVTCNLCSALKGRGVAGVLP